MKQMISVVMIVVVLFAGVWAMSDWASHYTLDDCVVVSVDDEVVTIVDRLGNEWMWEAEEGEHFTEGQTVVMTMNTNSTDNCWTDDIIEEIK